MFHLCGTIGTAIVIAFGVALATFLLVDRDCSLVSAFVANLVTFNLVPVADGTGGLLLALSVMLLAVLATLLSAYDYFSRFGTALRGRAAAP